MKTHHLNPVFLVKILRKQKSKKINNCNKKDGEYSIFLHNFMLFNILLSNMKQLSISSQKNGKTWFFGQKSIQIIFSLISIEINKTSSKYKIIDHKIYDRQITFRFPNFPLVFNLEPKNCPKKNFSLDCPHQAINQRAFKSW